MPGIAGFIDRKKRSDSDEILNQMLKKMTYSESYHQEVISYNDLFAGSTYIHEGDGVAESDSAVAVFYGEIFEVNNHDNLGKLPVVDAVEVLKYIESYGFDVVKDFNGAFALAYYEKENGRLMIVSDRMSVHRIYVWRSEDFIAFSSEAKSFYCFDEFKAVPDFVGIGEFLTSRFCFGRRTLWKNIKMCSPGSIVVIDGSSVSEETYWNADYDKDTKLDKKTCVDYLYRVMQDSVRKRCPELDIAMGLSGGCDARTVLNFLTLEGDRIHSYTYGPSNSGDVLCAKKLSDAFGTDGHYVDFTDDDLIDFAKEVVWRTDGIAEADLFFHIKMTNMKAESALYEVSSVPGDAVSGKINAQTSVMLMGNRSYHNRNAKTKLFKKLYKLGLKGKPDFGDNSVFSKEFIRDYRDEVERDYINVSAQRCTSENIAGIVLQNQLLMATTGRSIPVMGGVPSSELVVRFPFLDYHVLDTFGKTPYRMWREQKLYLKMIQQRCPKIGEIPHYVTGTAISPRMNNRFIYLKIKDFMLRKLKIQQRNSFLSDTYDFKRDIIARDARGYVKDQIMKPHVLNDKLFDPLNVKEIDRLFISARRGNEKDYQTISTRFNAAILSEVFFD